MLPVGPVVIEGSQGPVFGSLSQILHLQTVMVVRSRSPRSGRPIGLVGCLLLAQCV